MQKIKILFIIFSFFLLINAFVIEAKDNFTLEEMKNNIKLFSMVSDVYMEKDMEAFSKEVWKRHGLLVTEENAKKESFLSRSITDEKDWIRTENKIFNGQYRYLGTTPEGYLVENPDYPADALSQKKFSQFNWLENENRETNLMFNIKNIENDKIRKAKSDFYWDLIETSFTNEFGSLYDKENITPEIKERILRAAILVYPMVDEGRVLLSFRNKGNNGITYEVTASNLYLKDGPEQKVEETIENREVENLPQATEIGNGSIIIGSKAKGEEIFDVAKGIPTTETLYVNVKAESFKVETGSKQVEKVITKTYKTFDIHKKEWIVTKQSRTLSCNVFTSVNVYALDKVEVANPALPQGKILLQAPEQAIEVSMTEGGFQGESPVNGSLTINGITITAGEAFPQPEFISEDSLSIKDLVIPANTPNQKQAKTTGKVQYKNVYQFKTGDSHRTTSIKGNPVTIHTPVVCYPTLQPRTPKANEEYKATKNPIAYVKEEAFVIHYPTTGQHLEIKGYGNRDYRPYIAKRQVRFSFDAYLGEGYQGNFVPADTWVDFPAEQKEETASVYIPAWVEESEEHAISFRTLPINLADETSQAFEENANREITKYKAVQRIDITITGKVKEYTILHIDDKTKKNLQFPVYPSQGKVKKRLDGIALGTPIDLLIQTNHDLFHREDRIEIVPRYYFVDKKGKKTEVDLYYHGNRKLYKISKTNQDILQSARLRDFSKGIKPEYFQDTAKILDSQKRKNGFAYQDYLDALQGVDYVPLGDNAQLAVKERLKLYSGRDILEKNPKPQGVEESKIKRARQNWYYRFFLPNETYAIAKGTDLKKLGAFSLNKEPFLRKGYLLVHFQVRVVKEGEVVQSYWAEPKSKAEIPYSAKLGDVFFYDTERRASQRLN